MASWNSQRRCILVSDRPSESALRGLRPSASVFIAVLSIAATLGGGGLGSAAVEQTEILDRILAIVDGQVIMQSDVRAFIELRLVDAPPGPDQESRVLTYLIERRLVLDQVDRFVAEPAPDIVNRRFELMQDRFGSERDFAALLGRLGLTPDDMRQVLADDVRTEVYLADRFAAVDDERREQARDDWVADLFRRAQIRRPSVSSP